MGIAKATLNGALLAETSTWQEVDENIYFPETAINKSLFIESDHTTYCGWKGGAKYYSIVIGDMMVPNAAWYYPEPYEKAKHIKNFVAFYTNKVTVTVEKGPGERST
ncbi:DUF427 domain-containing protein [Aspergillus alliaceus]|uniref:DUF427 domain-containing protein n=1 Tax=Petromyces alliaceus TaxID=209559 RepID=UPI0012A71B69|nr:uncharacterized protein BDW43DRAFT_135367 [Aspergillus alliaceus]KAB8231616.1 hypothetical protein BDW43DRAFT_135367 [Aspergillus alliaceus]